MILAQWFVSPLTQAMDTFLWFAEQIPDERQR
jgi:hypothetical protein